MNNDLKWLAEYVAENGWEKHATHIMVCDRASEPVAWLTYQEVEPDNDLVFTRAEIEAAQNELSGKPSWDDAPARAEYLAQDADGNWLWYSGKPFPIAGTWAFKQLGLNSEYELAARGVVMADWRKTLEKRPVVDESLPWVPEVGETVTLDPTGEITRTELVGCKAVVISNGQDSDGIRVTTADFGRGHGYAAFATTAFKPVDQKRTAAISRLVNLGYSRATAEEVYDICLGMGNN